VSEDACVARWCRCERIVAAGEGLSELGVVFVRGIVCEGLHGEGVRERGDVWRFGLPALRGSAGEGLCRSKDRGQWRQESEKSTSAHRSGACLGIGSGEV
jgi:hypothetical protein